ncbi:hypothetical protein [Pseudozobellia sp. WGM2]|uniref:hypothetical protein n=1 Tax=Pseudozobellia sp. WGM2 TaxID=2787625 RepID=UPI001ADFC5E0|nr:hypothetical protein [Pseudozobellia sp. WGM2]
MQRIIFLGLLILLGACSSKVSKEDLGLLNGYWEISKVTFPDGNIKEYNVNTSVDFIMLEDLKGYRKKMQPNLSGTYRTSDDAESFVVAETDDSFAIHYKTDLSEWTEVIETLQKNTFSVTNEEGIRYDYKRFEPISIPQ